MTRALLAGISQAPQEIAVPESGESVTAAVGSKRTRSGLRSCGAPTQDCDLAVSGAGAKQAFSLGGSGLHSDAAAGAADAGIYAAQLVGRGSSEEPSESADMVPVAALTTCAHDGAEDGDAEQRRPHGEDEDEDGFEWGPRGDLSQVELPALGDITAADESGGVHDVATLAAGVDPATAIPESSDCVHNAAALAVGMDPSAVIPESSGCANDEDDDDGDEDDDTVRVEAVPPTRAATAHGAASSTPASLAPAPGSSGAAVGYVLMREDNNGTMQPVTRSEVHRLRRGRGGTP
eukprot:364721-Chlamydomonas_euryale.AAC.1